MTYLLKWFRLMETLATAPSPCTAWLLLRRSLKILQVLLDQFCIGRQELAAGSFLADIHTGRSACAPVRGFTLCVQVGVGHQLGGIRADLRLFVGAQGRSVDRLCDIYLQFLGCGYQRAAL